MRTFDKIVAWTATLAGIGPAMGLGWMFCQYGVLTSWREPSPWLLTAMLLILNGVWFLAQYHDEIWSPYAFWGLMYLATLSFQAAFRGVIPGIGWVAVFTGMGFAVLLWQLILLLIRP